MTLDPTRLAARLPERTQRQLEGRVATILVDNGDGTVDVDLAGATLTVPVISAPLVGGPVVVVTWDGNLVALTAFSAASAYVPLLVLGDPDTYIDQTGAADTISVWAGGVEIARFSEGTDDQLLIDGTGSATVPLLARITDPNTGIGWSAADQLAVILGGAERGLFKTTGYEPGPGSFVSGGGQIYTDGTNGVYIIGQTGSANDLVVAEGSGGTLFTNPVGTTVIDFASTPTRAGSAIRYAGSHDGVAAIHAAMDHTGHTIANIANHNTAAHAGFNHSGHNGGDVALAANMRSGAGNNGWTYNSSRQAIKRNIFPILPDDRLPPIIETHRIAQDPPWWRNPVLDLIPVSFVSIPDQARGRTHPIIGFVAEQVMEVFPEAASWDPVYEQRFDAAGDPLVDAGGYPVMEPKVDDDGNPVVTLTSWDVNMVVAALLAEVKSMRKDVDQLRSAV